MACASSWILPGVVVAALVGVGGYSMMRGECGSCLISEVLHTDSTVVATDTTTATGGCCALSENVAEVTLASETAEGASCESSSKAGMILAAAETEAESDCCMSESGEVVLASGETEDCAMHEGDECCKGEGEACCKDEPSDAKPEGEKPGDAG